MTEPTATQQPTTYDAPDAAAGSRFVWHDLMTTDLTKSLAFYTALFGWTRRPFDMGPGGTYDMLFAGETGLGGMVPLGAGDDVPAHWIGYISVEDVDAACRQVEAAGGKTCVPPTDIPTVGRFAVVEDPQGAVFSPFRSSTPAAAPPPVNPPLGTVAWNELMTSDPEQAAEFYTALTGWTVQKVDMGGMGFYYLFKQGERNVAGMMKHPAADQRPSWTPYFAVASADESAAKATELGATVIVPPADIEDWGRFYMALDTTGAAFATLENKKPMDAPSA